MKVSFVAKKAFAAYLASSADSGLTKRTGAWRKARAGRGAALVRPREVVAANQHPVGMGKIMYSGALTQKFGIGANGDFGSGLSSRSRRLISQLVPTGTVDLVTTTAVLSRCGAISLTAS